MTSVVSPYGMPVTTGKPGIRLALSSFGFSQSPLPALCRQATTCAWRSRLWKIPDRRSGRSRGHAEAGPEGIHARRWRPNRSLGEPFRNPWGVLANEIAKEVVQEAHQNGTETRAKPYAQCGLRDMRPQKHVIYCIFLT